MLAIAFLLFGTQSDTLRILPAVTPPVFDGRADSAEYGAPSVTIARPGGPVRLWLRRQGGFVYLAAQIPDRTYYWGDDLVISLDTRGDRAPSPQHDDFQWYFRRALDSSVVYRGEAGRWRAPRDDPDWRLGPSREGGGWEVRAAGDSAGWSLELRLDADWFTQASGSLPGIEIRLYDDNGNVWYPWPRPPGIRQPTEVERRPELWVGVGGG
jgi:hypothetical protein